MSRWKQWVRPPEGALPGGIVTKAGVVLIAVLVGGLLLSLGDDGSRGGRHSRSPARGAGGRRRDGPGASGPHSARGRAADPGGRRPGACRARAPASRSRRRDGPAPDRVGGCRSLDRRTRGRGGVRASGGASPGGAGAEDPLAPRPADRPHVQDSGRHDPDVRTHRRCGRRGCGGPREHGPSGARLLRAVGRGARERIGSRLAGNPLLLGSPGIAAPASPASGPRASLRAPGPVPPVPSVQPVDPPGWERIHEGSFLEAVLLTQLSGDFPGPVLAMVSVPFHSADRQRVLIPRGARVVGAAQAVRDRDQSRLAVAVPPVDHARRELDRPRVHRPEPGGRGRASGPSRPPLLQHVRGRRSRRCRERTRLGRRLAVRTQGRASARDSARARPRLSTGS